MYEVTINGKTKTVTAERLKVMQIVYRNQLVGDIPKEVPVAKPIKKSIKKSK